MKTNKTLFRSASCCIILFSVILFQVGCTKDNSSSNNNNNTNSCIGPQPKLQFKSNGVLYNLDALFNSKLGWINSPVITKIPITPYPGGPTYKYRCRLQAGNDKGDLNYLPNTNMPSDAFFLIDFSYNNPKLLAGNYKNDAGDMFCTGTNNCAECNTFNNTITININTITNGYASGTFSGNIPAGSSPCKNESMTITDGVFSNIPVFE